MNIYVGNLSREVGEAELRTLFEQFGQVTSAAMIKDRETGRSRGFGFVEMPLKDEAEAAIASLNSREHYGRTLHVNPANPRPERGSGGGGGRDSRGGGGGGYRGGNQRDNRERYSRS